MRHPLTDVGSCVTLDVREDRIEDSDSDYRNGSKLQERYFAVAQVRGY
jgi:hypothetical protein